MSKTPPLNQNHRAFPQGREPQRQVAGSLIQEPRKLCREFHPSPSDPINAIGFYSDRTPTKPLFLHQPGGNQTEPTAPQRLRFVPTATPSVDRLVAPSSHPVKPFF